MKTSFEITGDKALEKQLRNMTANKLHAAGASLYQSAEMVMTKSKEEFVPVKTGALRSTGMVQLPEIDSKSVSVTLSYGGPSVDYAIIVHEDMTAHHPHGQAKYLETPLKASLEQIANKLSEDLSKV